MLESIKERLINTLPFYTTDFSDYINITNISVIDDKATLTLEQDFDIENLPDNANIFVSGIYSSWNLNLNASMRPYANNLCLFIECTNQPYIRASEETMYEIEGLVLTSKDLTLQKELKGKVKILQSQGYVDSNNIQYKKFTIILKNVLTLTDFIRFCELGYTIDASNCKISLLNLTTSKNLGFNRKLKKENLIQSENKKEIAYKVNTQENNPKLNNEVKAYIAFNHRIYKTGISPNNADLLLTQHLKDNGEILPENTIYITDGGSTALTNINTASGQDGNGSFYMTRQKTFSIFLFIPNSINDNRNNSLFADKVDAVRFYIDKIVKELQGASLKSNTETISNITLLTDEPIPTNNPNLFVRGLTFQSTFNVYKINCYETNPEPLGITSTSVSQVNVNPDKYQVSTFNENNE